MFSLPRLMTSTAVLAAALIAPPAHAQMAVIDPAAIAQAVEVVSNTLEQIEQLQEQIEKLEKQILLAEEQLASITGERPFIVGINGDIEIHEMPGSVHEYETEIEQSKETYQIIEASTIFDDDRPEAINAHNQSVDAILANLSSVTDSIAAASEAIPRYEVYRTELGKTADLKESMDLNNRIAVENGMMLSQLLHSISMQNNMLVREQVEDLQRRHEQERMLGTWEFVALEEADK